MENASAEEPLRPHLSDEIIRENLLSNIKAATPDECDTAMRRTIARYGSEAIVNIARGMSLNVQLAVKKIVGEEVFNAVPPSVSTPDIKRE